MMANGDANTKVVAILSGIIGACAGLILSYFTALADISVLQTQIDNIYAQIQSGMDDRYRGGDARRDFALVEEKIRRNADQIAELERLLRSEIERHNEEHR